VLEAIVERGLFALCAMAGRDDEAREYGRRSSAVLDEVEYLWPPPFRTLAAEANRLLGDTAAAERELLAVWRSFRMRRDPLAVAMVSVAANSLATLCCDEGRWG